MTQDREGWVAATFDRHGAAIPLCTTCVEILGVSGAGVTLMGRSHSGPVCASNDRTAVLEDLQFTLGEGPCQDAYTRGEPILQDDLAVEGDGRWPTYAPQALQIGARGVFAFPLRAGLQPIGVLTLYQDGPQGLSAAQEADSLVVADVLTATMLRMQSRSASDVLADGLSDPHTHRAQVHQASGMVAVQLGIGVDQALLRIRAHAFATDRTAAAVADDIVAGTLLLRD